MNNKIIKFQKGNVLPEITVVPNKLFLYTYYPLINSKYPFTGHSELRVSTPDYFRDMGNGYAERVEGTSAHINKKMKDSGYNLVTNNCADATRCALEAVSGKEMNPYFFTIPGDVLDFFKENFDVRKVKNDGKRRGQETWYTNITPLLAEVIKNQLYKLIQENKKDRLKLLANARKWKHLEGGQIRKMQTAAGGPIKVIPEVTITPDKKVKVLGNNIREIIKDPILRNNFYNYILNSDEYQDIPYISDNEKILRFINLYKKSGNPKIHVISPHGRPHYIGGVPFINDIYASTSYYDNEKDNDNIVAELSHAYQYNNDFAKQLKLKPEISRLLKQGIKRIFNDDESYKKIGNFEYDAHNIIEPAMHEYIKGSTDNFEKHLKDFTNEVRNYPEYYSSGIDKFADYKKYKKGGKAFIERVNVLDSNPKISKAASRRVKKADDGTKLNAFLKVGNFLNSDTGKAIGSTLINGLSAGFQAKQMNDAINEYELASKAKLKKIMNGISTKDYYNQVLLQMNPNENLSLVVLNTRAYALALQDALKKVNETKDESALLLNKIKQLASEQNLNNFSNVLGGIALLGSLLNNKPASKVDNGTPSKTNFLDTPTV